MNAARILRVIAIAIAVIALIDPAITTRRRVDAVVAIVPADPVRDAELAARVAATLDAFTTVHAPFAAASATVLVGARLPAHAAASGGRAFAVLPAGDAVRIEDVAAPARAPRTARVPIVARVAVRGMNVRAVDVSLLDGAVVLDRVSIDVSSDSTLRVPLWFVPAAEGATRLRVRAAVGGDTTHADVALDIADTRRTVLFYDPRPSWLSTFVRRTLEQDARFVVTSRTVTSRDAATEFGRAPRRLDDARTLDAFDVIVVGAPEALAPADVAGLERFLRRRGGGVALLLDRAAGGPYERLAGVGAWSSSAGTTRELAAAGAAGGLRATDMVWPATMPPLARPVAAHRTAPAVWSVPVGAGTLVVSGALDAWRFRDPDLSAFDTFWPALIAGLAEAAPAPVHIALDRAVARPGEWVELDITARDAALAPLTMAEFARTSMAASVDGMPVRVWPAAGPGVAHGRFRAPAEPGVYEVSAVADSARAVAHLVVAEDIAHASRDERALLHAWTASRGGVTLEESDVGRLADRIEQALRVERTPESWHPMRSAWWIVPFALALGGEWYIRRRRGLL